MCCFVERHIEPLSTRGGRATGPLVEVSRPVSWAEREQRALDWRRIWCGSVGTSRQLAPREYGVFFRPGNTSNSIVVVSHAG